MNIEEFIKKCKQSKNLKVMIDYPTEYQIKIVNCSEDVKEHILSKLLNQFSDKYDNMIDGYIIAKINAHYGDIILYKIDDILDVIKKADSYEKMYEKLSCISRTRKESEYRRYAPFYVSYSYKSLTDDIKLGVGIKLNAETYSGYDSEKVLKVLDSNFRDILTNAGISYLLENNIVIRKKECDEYQKNKKWCKDTRQKEEFDKLFGF